MKRAVDELLEQLWMAEEQGKAPATDDIHAHLKRVPLSAAVEEATRLGLAAETDGRLHLTDAGRQRARGVIRRHRLAERLMSDVVEVSEERMESNACQFEHTLSEEVLRSICVLLGHPTTCPHGLPIPPGPCCAAQEAAAAPVVTPLTTLEAPGEARVVYIATRHHQRLDQLASLGLVPDAVVHLRQRHPSYILRIGETSLAVDEDTARDIYVRRVEPSSAENGMKRRRRRWGQ